MPDFVLGGVGVVVSPDFSGFHREAKAHIEAAERDLPSINVHMEPDLAAGFKREAAIKAKEGTEGVTAKVDLEPTDRGFRTELRRQVTEAAKLVTAEVSIEPKLTRANRAEFKAKIEELAAGAAANVGIDFTNPRTLKIELNRVLREAAAGAEVKVGINLTNPRTLKIELRKALAQASEGAEIHATIRITNPRTLRIELNKAIAEASRGLEIRIPVRLVGGAEARAEAKALAASISSSTAVPIERASARGGKAIDSLRKVVGFLGTGLKYTAIGLVAVAAGVAAVGAAGVKAASDLELQRKSLSLLLGSAREGTRVFDQLLKVANTTPFEIPQVLETARQLQVAGLAGERLIPSLTTLADITAELGGTGTNLRGVAIALSKIQGQGKVTQRELRTIFTNLPGFSPIKAIAKELGVSVPEAFKKITASQVPAQTAINALLKGMKEFPGAAGAAAKITSETFKGALSNVPDLARSSFFNAFQSALPELTKIVAPGGPLIGILDRYLPGIATAFVPIVKSLTDVILGAAPVFNELVGMVIPLFREIGVVAGPVLKGLGVGLAAIAPGMGDLVKSLGSLVLEIVPLLGPIGAVVGQILTGVAAAIDGADLTNLRNALMDAVGFAGNLFHTLEPLLPFAITVADTIAGMFDGAIGAANVLLTVISPITGALGKSEVAARAVGIVIGTVLLIRTGQWVASIWSSIAGLGAAGAQTGILAGVSDGLWLVWQGIKNTIWLGNAGLAGMTAEEALASAGAVGMAASLRAAAVAMAPFAAAVAAGGILYGLNAFLHSTSKRADALRKSLDTGVHGDSYTSVVKGRAKALAALQDVEERFGSNTKRRFENVGQFFDVFHRNTVRDMQAEQKTAEETWKLRSGQYDKLVATAKLSAAEISKATHGGKISFGQLFDLMDKFNIDPSKVGVTKATKLLTTRIYEFAAATHSVTPQQVTALFNLGAEAAEKAALSTEKASTAISKFIDPVAAFSGQADVTQAKIREWFKNTTLQTSAFATNIRKAIQDGYDPAFISQILEQGPAQAGSFLDALVRGHGDTFRKEFEAAQEALANISSFAVEQARLNNLAVNANTRQMAGDLQVALALNQAEFASGYTLTLDDVAKKIHKSAAEVLRVSQEYGLGIEAVVNPLLQALGGKVVGTKAVGGRAFMAEGGVVPGPPVRQDVVPAMLMPGEVVIKRASVEHFGLDNMLRINKGEWPAGWPTPRRYADGGVVQAPQNGVVRGQRFAAAQVGKPYVWGAVGPNAYDCSGLWSAIIATVQDQAPRRLFTSSSIIDNAKKIGMLPGLGAVSVGSRRGSPGHVAGTIGGLNYEATPPRVLGPGRARGANNPMFTHQFHIGEGVWVGPNGMVIPVPPHITGHGGYGDTGNLAMLREYAVAKAWMDANTFATPTSLGSLMEPGVGGRNDYRALGKLANNNRGWGRFWPSLDSLWTQESHWNPRAQNPSSTAYGIPQLLDGTWAQTGIRKTADAALQIEAGLRYIAGRYGDPATAWREWQVRQPHWYENGGLTTKEQLAWVSERNKPELILPLTKPDRVRQLSDQHGLTDFLLRERDQGRGGSRRDGPAMVVQMTPPDAREPETYAAAMESRLAPLLEQV